MVEARIDGGVFDAPTRIWSAPEIWTVGDAPASGALARSDKGLSVEIRKQRVTSIREGEKRLERATLQPAFVTYLPDENRTLRRPLTVDDFPDSLENAVIAIEDHRFYEHSGVDIKRTLKAVMEGLAEGRRPRGTSTLTQQLARGLFLTPQQTYSRKLAEFLIALRLEQQLSKRQILENYLNQIYMGRFGGYNIAGMAEASRVYFDRDVRSLELHQAALLAGLLQRPSYLDPFRYPQRAVSRRNAVLDAMLEYGYIDRAQRDAAVAKPLGVVAGDVDDAMAPYFVDLVEQELNRIRSGKAYRRGLEVRTTIDLRLQRAALSAVDSGMAEVDKQLANKTKGPGDGKRPQVALVALDPRTGAVKALIGGRDFDQSQLNRALAKRQPGSTFKPFVYAAALNSAPRTAGGAYLTTATPLLDWPATFRFKDESYRPANYGHVVRGYVTVRDALVYSLNIATVKLATAVGYDKVADMAHQVGLENVRATPSAALGAYEVSPLELAAAYTVFANQGRRVEPYFVDQVRNREGVTSYSALVQATAVLDPRVAYITTDILEDVMNRGTAAGVRSRGYRSIAAGKTGTDEDGWFVGFTPKLLCLVWVGFDDNSDLGLTGADSALPVWTAFMKQAEKFAEYKPDGGFDRPEGIEEHFVDPEWLTTEDPADYNEERLVQYVETVNEADAEVKDNAAAADTTEMEPLRARFKPLPLKARMELFLAGTAPEARVRFPGFKLFAVFGQ